MDDFLEQTAIRRKHGLFSMLYYLTWMLFALFTVATFFLGVTNIVGTNPETGKIAFSIRALIITVVCGGLAFLCWRQKDNFRVEYDYSFTNGTLDVSKVLNNRRRRYLCSVEVKDVIRCGPATGPAFKKTLAEPGIKVHNFFLNRDAKLYFFYFAKKGVKHVLVLELNDEMIAVMRSKSNYIQRAAWYDADGQQHYGTVLS